MSKQNALAFLEKLEKDQAFASALQNAKNFEERRALLKKANFLFSKDEYRQAYQEKHHKKLTDAELDKMIAEGKREGEKMGAPIIVCEE